MTSAWRSTKHLATSRLPEKHERKPKAGVPKRARWFGSHPWSRKKDAKATLPKYAAEWRGVKCAAPPINVGSAR